MALALDETTAPVEAQVAAPWPRPVYAWYVVAVLVLAYAFAILDRTAIGFLVDPMKRDLKVSDSQIGLLQGLAFAVCYTMVGIPLGVMADRGRRKPLLAIGIAVWSVATMACGLARSFGVLFVARLGVGFGEASVSPACGSLIADYFPPKRRPMAFSVWLLGSTVGSAMASIFTAGAIVLSDHVHATGAPWAAHLATWQITFLLIGAPGLAVALLFALTVREPARRGQPLAADGSAAPHPLSLGSLWTMISTERGAYLALMGGAMLNLAGIYAQLGWMPALMMRVHHWSPARFGATFGVASVPVSVTGALIAGATMSWLAKRGRRDGPILIIMGDALFRLIFGVAACLAPRPEIAVAMQVIAGLTATWSYAAAMTGLSQITPNALRGQVTAVFTLGTGLISMTLGAFVVGALSDHIFTSPGGVAASLATTYAGVSILALTLTILGRGRYAACEARNA